MTSPHTPRQLLPPPSSSPAPRRPGRPGQPVSWPLSDTDTVAALHRLLEVSEQRRSGRRYWDFPFGARDESLPGPCVEGGTAATRVRQITVAEALSKLRTVARFLGMSVEVALEPDRWRRLPAARRREVGLLLGRIGRSERPRLLLGRSQSWRRVEDDLFARAEEAYRDGSIYRAVAARADLPAVLGVDRRTLQKALARVRAELATEPGLHARVHLWLGPAPTKRPPSSGASPGWWLWVSRLSRPRPDRPAALLGLLPADTPAEAKATVVDLNARRRAGAPPRRAAL